MLIQDLRFFEIIDNLEDIKGGTSSSASSKKPGAKAKASAVGDLRYVNASTTRKKGRKKGTTTSASVIAVDIERLEILEKLVSIFW